MRTPSRSVSARFHSARAARLVVSCGCVRILIFRVLRIAVCVCAFVRCALQCTEGSAFVYLSDAQDAYNKRLRHQKDKQEREAWAKLRGTKALESLLREAGYSLQVVGAKSLALMEQHRAAGRAMPFDCDDEMEQPGAAAASPPAAAAGLGNPSPSRRRGGAGTSSYLLRNRRWLHDSEWNPSHPRVGSIMEGGLPRTDAALLTRQLAAMMAALKGRYMTWHRAGEPALLGGDIAKLVWWLQHERDRDRNPAAAPAEEPRAEEYRPQPQLQVTILPEPRAAKKARAEAR